MSFPALLDTCVLFGSGLTDLILRLAEREVFRPLWSDDILDELERNLIKHKAASAVNARRRVTAMRDNFEAGTGKTRTRQRKPLERPAQRLSRNQLKSRTNIVRNFKLG
ncbi:MAG: PIN domain-containing protein [Rothia sp. (in: high G+C Gram-positive bacteria)]|nr:PIN domain-containing protein [Rothia sp. (in: high G+C Gram-positive bacteria)]